MAVPVDCFTADPDASIRIEQDVPIPFLNRSRKKISSPRVGGLFEIDTCSTSIDRLKAGPTS